MLKWEGDTDELHGIEPFAHLSADLEAWGLDPRLVEPMVTFVGDDAPRALHREAQPEAAPRRRPQPAAPGLPLLDRRDARRRPHGHRHRLPRRHHPRQRLPRGGAGQPPVRAPPDAHRHRRVRQPRDGPGWPTPTSSGCRVELPAGSVVFFGAFLAHATGSEPHRHAAAGPCSTATSPPRSRAHARRAPPPSSSPRRADAARDARRRRRHLGAVPKIGDVARAAGVSPATVSRVLNGTGTVAPERAAAVRRAAERARLHPVGPGPRPAPAAARGCGRRSSPTSRTRSSPRWSAGSRTSPASEGHRLVLCNSDEDLDKEAAYLDIALAEQMAGVVIAVASDKESRLDALLDRGVPVVAVDRRPRATRDEVDSVVVDNVLGARLATEHLIDAGADADRVRHRTVPGEHRPRAAERLPARAAGPRPPPPGRTWSAGPTSRRRAATPPPGRCSPPAAPRCAVRGQQPHDARRPAGRHRGRAPRARRRPRSSASTTRRGPRSCHRRSPSSPSPPTRSAARPPSCSPPPSPDLPARHVVLPPALQVRASSCGA